MVSFNILGDCVSRDILTPIIDRGKAQVLQYVSFTNPISTVSEKPDSELQFESLEKMDGVNFDKRCLFLDYNKKCFEYLFKKKSDFVIFDILDARAQMVKKDKHYITISSFFDKHRDDFQQYIDLKKYNNINPFTDISKDEMDSAVQNICEKLLNVYTPNQIIIHKHFMVQNYCNNSNIIPFPTRNSDKIDLLNRFAFYNSQEGINKTNRLVERLFDEIINIMRGCHVIEFPQNVVADRAHKWGLSPLHYMPLYYEYGSKAIEIICNGYSEQKEKDELAKLNEQYSEKNELMIKKLEVRNLKIQYQFALNALNFSKSLIYDQLENNKFIKWLEDCASSGKKVAVLKCRDVAGQILHSALNKYNIEIIMESVYGTFSGLSSEEIELCHKADIIICADVHSTAPVECEGLNAVKISDLLK